jgi:hypothetical protein
LAKRAQLVELEKSLSFSYGLEESLTEEEKRVDHILKRLKGQIKNDNYNTIVHDFYDHLVSVNQVINNSLNFKAVSFTRYLEPCQRVEFIIFI